MSDPLGEDPFGSTRMLGYVLFASTLILSFVFGLLVGRVIG